MDHQVVCLVGPSVVTMRFVGYIFPGYISPVCILPRYVSTAEAGYISPEFTTMDTSLHCPVSLFHS